MTNATSTTMGHAFRSYLGSRRGLILLGLAALSAAAAFNWSWLAAVGIAPILVAAAPCAAMCALGLCMNKMMGRSCSTASSIKPPSDTRPTDGLVEKRTDRGAA